jgi:hypothetical protein
MSIYILAYLNGYIIVVVVLDEREMMLATDWDFRDLTGRCWSEKFRGCRAYWQSSTREFWTRGGNPIPVPNHWKRFMPATDLDGEIWAGYCDIETIASLAVRLGKWNDEIVFMVFDSPQTSGNWLCRMADADRAVRGIPFARTVERGVVATRDDASKIAARIIRRGGEGAVFRSPDCGYKTKRTCEMMRIKAHNMREPWRRPGYVRHQTTHFRAAGGLDTSLFPSDPEIDYNITVLHSPAGFFSPTNKMTG